MNLNADFSKRVVVHASSVDWKSSPVPGVERRMLDRIGDEVARATSIVRYAPGSYFPPHVHGGGEEFLVLEGEFQDEQGVFPAGSYVRNPPQSRHTPASTPGCMLFVKLWQFDLADRTHVVIDTNKLVPRTTGRLDGVRVFPLFADGRENVRLEQWAPGTVIEIDPEGGLEVLVLTGGFSEGGETYGMHSWLRLPIGAHFRARVAADGCRVWIKEGHLRHVQTDIAWRGPASNDARRCVSGGSP
ncbi:MAG TPA: cupin domain-containing protein [Xanthobacteraceae bacterium]